MNINDNISVLKGIGKKKADLLKKININTIEDLLFYYPRDYEDRREVKAVNQLCEGETALIRGKIMLIVKSGYGYGKKRTLKLLVSDETGGIEIIFFHAAYLEKILKRDVEYVFYGKITGHAGRLQMLHPDFSVFSGDSVPGVIPIYPLTQGITQGDIRKWQKQALHYINELSDYLPPDIVNRNRLCDLEYAVRNIHFPEDIQRYKEAKYRLIFDELFLLQTGLLSIKNALKQKGKGISYRKDISVTEFTKKLPFEMTDAQKRVLAEIEKDMESDIVMNRLLQGDVGSGKTAVAAAAVYKAVKSGYQAVMMAPTELLAEQHYNSLNSLFKPFNIVVDLLTGSMNQKRRQQLLSHLKAGEIDLLLGTHALIQPDVEFGSLGLVITDEQHRFGVNQRGLLTKKGSNPDILVMTATPIPRTLAAILYGDLDLSVIDEMPPGRKPVLTKAVTAEGRDTVYKLMQSEVSKGRQAYIVAPLIEESNETDAKSAAGLYEEISARFSNFEVKLLHGSMKQTQKDQIMEDFYSGKTNILVSTVVIEVGINVPNATVMIIENAERFGLAALHQLRGRVGRGEDQSYCMLITEGKTEFAKERAKIMTETNDGFIIAEKDLELRGPGEFFGTRQHGIPELKLADLSKHGSILKTVRMEADKLLENDPKLCKEEHSKLKNIIYKTFENVEDISI